MARRQPPAKSTPRRPRELQSLVRAYEPLGAYIEQRSRLLASFRAPPPYGIFADRIGRLFDWPVARAQEELAALASSPRWEPTPIAGMEKVAVVAGPRYPRAMGLFVRFAPGLGFPRHKHPGGEVTFVLEGAFRDGSGAVIARGGELALGDGTAHDFTVLEPVPCLAAVIAYEGIEFG
jgi:hypothetical protein